MSIEGKKYNIFSISACITGLEDLATHLISLQVFWPEDAGVWRYRCSAGSVKIVDKAELTSESALAKTWLFLHPLTFRTILNFQTVQALCFMHHWTADFNMGITLPSEVRRKYIKSDATKGKSSSSQLDARELKQTLSVASHSWFSLNVSIKHEGEVEVERKHGHMCCNVVTTPQNPLL